MQNDLPSAPEIDGGAGWAAKAVRFDFDPTALALGLNFLPPGRNRQLVRLVALHEEFDFRVLYSRFQNTKGGIPYSGTFCTFSFWASKKKMGT